jgi:hypothetical protein
MVPETVVQLKRKRSPGPIADPVKPVVNGTVESAIGELRNAVIDTCAPTVVGSTQERNV